MWICIFNEVHDVYKKEYLYVSGFFDEAFLVATASRFPNIYYTKLHERYTSNQLIDA